MKQYAIFGGSFDPLHNGHVAAICSILKTINPDCLLIVPTGTHPEGKIPFFSGTQRLLMLKSFFGGLTESERDYLKKFLPPHDYQKIITPTCKNNKIIIRDDEINSLSTSYTIDFVRKIHKEHKKIIIHLFVGADQATHFGSWKDARKLSNLCTLWSIGRNNLVPDTLFPWNFLPFAPKNTSSTTIRQKLKNRQVPESIPKNIHILIKSWEQNRN